MTAVDFYSVLIETLAADDAPIYEDAVDDFMDGLTKFAGVVSVGARSWSARIAVEAPSAAEAVSGAAATVAGIAEKSGLPPWPVVRAGAVREDVLDADLTRPQLPDLVSGREAAELLGVSIQRVHQLASEHPDFPAPAYKLRAASLWLRPAIVAFEQRWERKAGRPRKVSDVA